MAITLHTAPEVEQEELRTRNTERDEFQKQIDTEVKLVVTEWQKAGKPEPGDKKAPYGLYVVAADDKSEMKSVIRRAASLHKAFPVFYTDVKLEEGLVQVKFNVTNPPPKKH